MTAARRRRLRGPALALAVATVAYGAGLATGHVTSDHSSTSAGRAVQGRENLDAVRDRIAAEAVRTVDPGQLDQAAVQGMLRALHDPYSSFFGPGDYASFQQTLDGHYSGVGLWVRARTDGGLYVAGVQPASPADRAGVRTGTLVATIDGRPARGMTAAVAAAALRGATGTPVSVGLGSGRSPRVVRLARVDLDSDDVTVDRLTPQVARITITAFTHGVGQQVRAELAQLRDDHVGGVVLDLRGDPGGLLEEAVQTASVFLPSAAPVVSYVGRDGHQRLLRATEQGDTATPVAVLVDGGTASAAEVLAAALQDADRAVVIGSRTYGKGTVQEPMRLSDGSAVEITVAHYRTPAGRSLDKVGLQPDIEVPPGSAVATAERRAVEVLAGLLADAGTGGHG